MLRAQLLEEGVEVEAYERIEDGLRALIASSPSLLVADLTASDDPNADIDCLMKWVTRVPTWIIASRSTQINAKLEALGVERAFYRPLDLNELVSLIRRRVLSGR